MSADSRPEVLTRRHYFWITLGFVLFVIYGSLVPLQAQPLSFSDAVTRYQEALSRSISFESRSDWLANILLFIPLGLVAMATLSVDRREISPLAILAVILGCVLLSGAIEFVQLWFPARFTSLNDIVAETFGGVIGLGIWMVAGQGLTNYVRGLWSLQGRDSSTARWIPGYLIVLVLVTGMPFDLTLSPGELKQKYVQGKVVLVPFTMEKTQANPRGEPLDLVRKAIINMAFFVPAGILLAGFRGRATRNPFLILGMGLLLAGAIEMMQLLVATRFFDVTDILTGSLAVLLGWAATRLWQPSPLSKSALKWSLLLLWVGALVFIYWEPFRFTADAANLSQRWQGINWVPFVDYYQRNYLNSFDEMFQKLILFAPLGVLLPGRMWSVVGLSILIAVGIAVGLLFWPDQDSRHDPKMSDVVLETIGAWLGYLVARGGNRVEA